MGPKTEKGERRKAREGREEGEVGGRKKKIGTMEESPPPLPPNSEFCGDLQA